jgi:hypothetical protein
MNDPVIVSLGSVNADFQVRVPANPSDVIIIFRGKRRVLRSGESVSLALKAGP